MNDLALTCGGERHDLIGYMDADGVTREHRKAISGSTFLIDGDTISWSSREQEFTFITPSMVDVEDVAATLAVKEGTWL